MEWLAGGLFFFHLMWFLWGEGTKLFFFGGGGVLICSLSLQHVCCNNNILASRRVLFASSQGVMQEVWRSEAEPAPFGRVCFSKKPSFDWSGQPVRAELLDASSNLWGLWAQISSYVLLLLLLLLLFFNIYCSISM